MSTTKIQETTVWFTYRQSQLGFGLVSKRSAKTDPQNYDGDTIFGHKLAENKDVLTDEDRAIIEKDCQDLVALLKKFYHEDDFIFVTEGNNNDGN